MPTLYQKTIEIAGRHYTICGAPDDTYFSGIEHEALGTKKLLYAASLADNSGVILDIGANCGLTSIALASSHRQVFSYEPNPKPFDSLCATISVNNLTNEIKPQNVAIGLDVGKLKLFPGGPIDHNRSSGGHIWNADHHWKPSSLCIEVPCASIDDEASKWGWDAVSFIKIDVEGFEESVLRGAARTLSRFSPVVFVEFNSWCLIAIANKIPLDFLRYLSKEFEYVYCFVDEHELKRISTPAELMEFMHRNLIQRGCVDDLLCSQRKL